jgi:hypothetical protein
MSIQFLPFHVHGRLQNAEGLKYGLIGELSLAAEVVVPD